MVSTIAVGAPVRAPFVRSSMAPREAWSSICLFVCSFQELHRMRSFPRRPVVHRLWLAIVCQTVFFSSVVLSVDRDALRASNDAALAMHKRGVPSARR
ncbi:hypothetical protein CNO08_18670 [Lysobacter capsici]|nr:hypothetical protein CNO08_18670 [Lysobacter capsici]